MLWLPPAAEAKLQNERRAYNAHARAMTEDNGDLARWNAECSQIDPNLQIVKARDNAQHPALIPGLYHFVRSASGGLATIVPIKGPDGGFRELDSSVWDLLAEADLWNDRAQRERQRHHDELSAARKRQAQREREDRNLAVMERAKAAWNPGVSMTGQGKGWSYRAGAKKDKAA